MQMEWSEEKFLKGIVGDKTRLRLWNKHQKIEHVFTQLARYNWMHGSFVCLFVWKSVEVSINNTTKIGL